MPNELTKLEAARRQLAVAIRLFFDERDAVSVYTLAANAWEIVDVLCKRRGVDGLSKETEGRLRGDQSLRHDFINEPYRNFFKHADRDPEGTVEGFRDERNDHLLMLAAEDLMRLEETKLLECQVFQIWYLAVYPEKIAPGALDRVVPVIQDALPDLGRKSRAEQKRAGNELLWRAGEDAEFLADPLTNALEFRRWRGVTHRRG